MGHLRLRTERLGARTVLVGTDRTAPFHVGPPSYRAGTGEAEVVIQSVGPGIFPGDDLLVEIEVGAGAELTVRGQAATKLYPAPADDQTATAAMRTELRVESGGRLVYLPGELIPFRDAAYRQETRITVAGGGSLGLGEILTAGRMAMGERDAFRRLEMRLRAAVDGRTVLIERGVLEPSIRPLTAVGRHGPFACVGSLYLFGSGWTASDQGPADGPVRWGCGGGAEYILVRFTGETVQAVRAAMEAMLVEAVDGS